jgi:hypothetical protein
MMLFSLMVSSAVSLDVRGGGGRTLVFQIVDLFGWLHILHLFVAIKKQKKLFITEKKINFAPLSATKAA